MAADDRRLGIEVVVQDVDVLGVFRQLRVAEPGGIEYRASAAGDGTGTEAVQEVCEVADEGQARVDVDSALVDPQHEPGLVDHFPRRDRGVGRDTWYHVGKPLAES